MRLAPRRIDVAPRKDGVKTKVKVVIAQAFQPDASGV